MENQSSMTKFFILSALKEKDMHGYELIMQLENRMGKKPSASQVYPVLSRMNKAGYVKLTERIAGKKRIKSYKITGEGTRVFNELNKRINFMISSALKEKIKVCAHCGCEVISGAVTRKTGGKTLYFCCNFCADSFKKV